MPKIGDRVLAKWPAEKQWWYPGVVSGLDGSSVEVQYDDGDKAKLGADDVRPLEFGAGSRVYCRWKGGGAYYAGRVTSVEGNEIHVDYDDGDKEMSTISMVRINRNDL